MNFTSYQGKMNRIHRRKFLQVLGGGGALLASARRTGAESTSKSAIEVVLDETIGVISPDIYGHFTEHIGGVIYDGIWVGDNSKIPNDGGIRSELVTQLRRIKPSVVRWPGGCFADSYNWRDGIGPRAQRPRRTNFWINDGFLASAPDGPAKYEPNQFGTNEFMHFCRLIGAQPYLAANLRGNTARDFDEWIEYCNAPAASTTLAEQRASGGDPEPFRVRYWGVGNESWGCGGNFTPEEYAAEFRRYTAWAPEFGVRLAFVASGPNGGDLDWTRKFFARVAERDRGILRSIYGWALHYYCGTSGKGNAIDFTTADWYDLLDKALHMASLIRDHWTAMGEVDREHRVKLVVDEWGAWHHSGTEVARWHLFGQTSTMRDALVAALTLDTFNRHADKVAMANVAQLINNLHSLFLAVEDRFVVTPNFHIFDMYRAHQNGRAVRTEFNLPAMPGKTLPVLAGSASLHERRLVLTVANTHATDPVEAELRVRGANIRSARGRVLTGPDIHAHNTFTEPRAVEPRDVEVRVSSGRNTHQFPRASVTLLELDLV